MVAYPLTKSAVHSWFAILPLETEQAHCNVRSHYEVIVKSYSAVMHLSGVASQGPPFQFPAVEKAAFVNYTSYETAAAADGTLRVLAHYPVSETTQSFLVTVYWPFVHETQTVCEYPLAWFLSISTYQGVVAPMKTSPLIVVEQSFSYKVQLVMAQFVVSELLK
jgi:hypothetical protein